MHDASAVLVADGKIVAAAEEERFSRIKHTKGFPENAIAFCLKQGGLGIGDIDIICASWKPWILKTRVTQAFKSFIKSPSIFMAKAERGMGQMANEWSELFRLKSLVTDRFGKGKYKITYLDHHLSHAASTFLCSPFDSAAIMTIDGAGESCTTSFYKGEGLSIKKLGSVFLPHSLGHFYSSITAFLGFKIHSDEYKIMALAAYGEPVYADFLRKEVLRIQDRGLYTLNPHFIDYHLARKGVFRSETTDILGLPREKGEEISKRHTDVAASAQRVLEEVIFHMAGNLYNETGSKNLCLAGGVAFNSVAAGKLIKHTPFQRIFTQPAAGDAGSALGAALYLENKNGAGDRTSEFDNIYLGPGFRSDECEKELTRLEIPYKKLEEGKLLSETAGHLAEGKLIYWFQGRMEWGARALGSRSLLADPRRAEMKDVINAKIKKREYFRPFAPSILSENIDDLFDYYFDSPFMLYTFPIKKEFAEKIPAVTHIDRTARPQSVSKERNPRYWRLIDEFRKTTNIPLLLNTSFNIQEPIVCTPQDAIKTFLNTGGDYLILEDCIAQLPDKNE